MIYDCFPFSYELDLLEIRLHELGDVVDRFVLVESPLTASLRPKDLWYAQNKSRFGQFADRIRHVVFDDRLSGCRQQECAQRDAVTRGLGRLSAEDWVIISDADEIVSSAALRRFLDGPSPSAVFRQGLYYYWVNNLQHERWTSAAVVRGDLFARLPRANFWRFLERPTRVIEHGGWHFSYVGGPEMIRRKLLSSCETQYARAPFIDLEHIRGVLQANGHLLAPQWKGRHTVVPLDDTFPRHLVRNREKFAHLIKQP